MTDSFRTATTQTDLATERLEQLIDRQRQAGLARLPRETELSEQLGVSRNTLRDALARLAARGVVERRRRLGTFIVDVQPATAATQSATLSYPIDEIVTLPSFFESSELPIGIHSVSVTTEPASQHDAVELGIEPGTAVYRVRRVFAMDGVGAAVGEHLLPTVLRGHGVHIEALTDGISTFLREVENISIDVVDHTAGAIAADAAIARDLALPVGSPVLVVDARLSTRDGDELKVVVIGRLVFNPGLVRVHARGTHGASAHVAS